MAAILNRKLRAEGLAPVNHKRVYRFMQAHNLLLARKYSERSEAVSHKGRLRDSSCESSMVVGKYEQTVPAELQDQELASLQGSVEAAWLPDQLVRSGCGLGASADRQAMQTAAVLRCRDPE